MGTLRPKRVPAPPILGFSRSLKVPSTVRAMRWRLPLDDGWSAGADEVSYRLLSRSLTRSRCHRNLLSSASVTSVNTRENRDLAIRERPFCAPLVTYL